MEGKDPRKALPPIEPPSRRWEPNPDPTAIHVPGLDTTAPLSDQLEYVEQMITLRLQNIDANFAKIHQILSTRILPAFKRFAVNTEPVREAAKFWTDFYERAAEVQILPTEDSFDVQSGTHTQTSTENLSSQREEPETDTQTSDSDSNLGVFDPNITPSESSFMPGKMTVSSTPMPGLGRAAGLTLDQLSGLHQDSSSVSWKSSLESPLDRIDRELQGLSMQDILDQTVRKQSSSQVASSSVFSTTTGTSASGSSAPTQGPFIGRKYRDSLAGPVFTVDEKGKGKNKVPDHVPVEGISHHLSRAPGADLNPTSSGIKRTASSDRPHGTPKSHFKHRNPYIPPGTPAKDWDGIVDLSKRAPIEDTTDDWSSDEDSLDIRPPISKASTIPPSRQVFTKEPDQFKLIRSPAKAAAQRIGKDIMNDVESRHRKQVTGSSALKSVFGRGFDKYETSESSAAPTPPSLSRYSKSHISSGSSLDPSLSSLMSQFAPSAPTASSSRGSQPPPPNAGGQSSFQLLPGARLVDEEFGGNDDSFDSFDESFGGDNGKPSAAFLMVSERGRFPGEDSDDSFQSSSDSLDGEMEEGSEEPVHPFARMNMQGGDDSFDENGFTRDDIVPDNGEDPTLFGGRLAATSGAPPGRDDLQLHGRELLEDTIGLGQRGGGVPETPTPYPFNR